MRRISQGNNPRYTLPPLSAHATSFPSLQQQGGEENRDMYHSTSTFSYSYPPAPTPPPQQQQQQQQQKHEEYYYPVYNKHEWSEDDLMPIVENHKIKKKKEMDDRIKEINREFLDNREVLYSEKIKQLQGELTAVEKGNHEYFDLSVEDLERKRRETINNARLMMIYQISTVDEQCNLNYKKVQNESIAEQKEIQNALFTIIEEKRKQLKREKDNDIDCLLHTTNEIEQHQTRNRKRLLRKRGDLLDTSTTTTGHYHTTAHQKRKQDRLKENPSHLIGILSHRVEKDLEADYNEMIKKR